MSACALGMRNHPGRCRAAAPALEIVSAEMTGPNEITLAWPAVVGRTYQVQYTADMGTVDWINTGPEINATRDLVAVAVSAPSAERKRFYRVMVVE